MLPQKQRSSSAGWFMHMVEAQCLMMHQAIWKYEQSTCKRAKVQHNLGPVPVAGLNDERLLQMVLAEGRELHAIE